MRIPSPSPLESLAQKGRKFLVSGKRNAKKILLTAALVTSTNCGIDPQPPPEPECTPKAYKECYEITVLESYDSCGNYEGSEICNDDEECSSGECLTIQNEGGDPPLNEGGNFIDSLILNSIQDNAHIAQIHTTNNIEVNIWGNQDDGNLQNLNAIRMESPEGELYIQTDESSRPILIHNDLGALIVVNGYLPNNTVDLSFYTPDNSHGRAILRTSDRNSKVANRSRQINEDCSLAQHYVTLSCDIGTIVKEWSSPEGFAAALVEYIVGDFVDENPLLSTINAINETIRLVAFPTEVFSDMMCDRYDANCNNLDVSVESILEDFNSSLPDFSPPSNIDQPNEPPQIEPPQAEPPQEPPQEGACDYLDCSAGQVPVNGNCTGFIQGNSDEGWLSSEKLVAEPAECHQTGFYPTGEDFIDDNGITYHHCIKSGLEAAYVTSSYMFNATQAGNPSCEIGENRNFFRNTAGELIVLCAETKGSVQEGDSVVTRSSFSRDDCPDNTYQVASPPIELPGGCYTHCVKTKIIE